MTASEREAEIARLYPIVRPIARNVSRRIASVDLDDLIGEGCLGLIRAVDIYDPARGEISLERFARAQVLCAMLNGVRRMDRLSEVTRRVLRLAENDLYATALQRGRMPSTREMEERHPKLRFARIAAHERSAVSLDNGLPIDALVSPDWETDPARTYAEYESRCRLRAALDRLPARHRQVVDLYYFSGYRLKAVAQRLSVTKQRIAQIRNDAVKLVRQEVLAS